MNREPFFIAGCEQAKSADKSLFASYLPVFFLGRLRHVMQSTLAAMVSSCRCFFVAPAS